MKKKNLYNFLALVFFFSLFFSCHKQVEYPPEPIIDFQFLTVKDTVENSELGNNIVLYRIAFKVIDGDNNLGISQEDFEQDSLYNLFVNILNKNNGQFDTVDLPLSLDFRIPQPEVVSIHNYFKALVFVDLTFDPGIISNFLDTFKFSFYVVDKDLNKSNEQETPEISLDFRGTLMDTVVVIH